MNRGPTGIVRDRLVETVARQLALRLGPTVSWEDLYDLGLPALHTARSTWNGKGRFEAFAMERIRWHTIDELRKRSRDALMLALAAAELGAAQGQLTVQDLARSHRPQRDAEDGIDGLLDACGANYALEVEAGEAAVEQDAERIRLRRAVTELPPPEDQVIDRYFYQGFTFREIAAALGIGETTAIEISARAIERLKRFLSPAKERFDEPARAPA